LLVYKGRVHEIMFIILVTSCHLDVCLCIYMDYYSVITLWAARLRRHLEWSNYMDVGRYSAPTLRGSLPGASRPKSEVEVRTCAAKYS
jgi:hypothetical protein